MTNEPDLDPNTLATFGVLDAEQPPSSVKEAIMAKSAEIVRPMLEPALALDVFGRCVDGLAGLLNTISTDQWTRPVAAYDWRVHELVAHLAAVERYTARVLSLDTTFDDGDTRDHLGVGPAMRAQLLVGNGSATAAAWSKQALDTVVRLRRGEGLTEGLLQFHVWSFTFESLLVARSFEIWTHSDDIRRALGQPVDAPAPADLRTMSIASVNSLELLVPLLSKRPAMPSTRVVLTGPGGGTFDLGRGDRQLTVVTGVVDYCRLAARRETIETIEFDIEGDEELARDLVKACQAVAV
jgi:uncharacterized protein (TIGR03083 family)